MEQEPISPLKIQSITSLLFSEEPLKIKFLKSENLIGVQTKKSIEIYRIFPKLQKISEIHENLHSSNCEPNDFNFAKNGKSIIYSNSKKRVFIKTIEKNENQKPYSLFKKISTNNLSNFQFVNTKKKIDSKFNCFKGISFDLNEKEKKNNRLDDMLNCSFTHLYTFRDNLTKIEFLENLIDNKEKIKVVSAISENGDVNVCFNYVFDFLKIDLKNFIDVSPNCEFDYVFSNDLKFIYFFGKEKRGGSDKEIFDLNFFCIDCRFFEMNLEELFFISYNISSIKAIIMNLRLGYFKAKSNFREVSMKIKNFLAELDLDEEENLINFTNFIKLGICKEEKITSFFEIFGLKKLTDFHEMINNKFDILLDFFRESFLPGLKRISAILQDLKLIDKKYKNENLNFFENNILEETLEYISFGQKSVSKLIKIIFKKITQLKNFFLFLFKKKLKIRNGANSEEEEIQFKQYVQSEVDFENLLEYLRSIESITLKDLLTDFDSSIFTYDKTKKNNNLELTNNSLIDMFKDIRNDLGLKNMKKETKNEIEILNQLSLIGIIKEIENRLKKFNPFFEKEILKNFKLHKNRNILKNSETDIFNKILLDDQKNIIFLFSEKNLFYILKKISSENFLIKLNLNFLSIKKKHQFSYNEKNNNLYITDNNNNNNFLFVLNLNQFKFSKIKLQNLNFDIVRGIDVDINMVKCTKRFDRRISFLNNNDNELISLFYENKLNILK